jgi:hypothetical protein
MMNDIEKTIEDNAETDGSYAIAYALLRVAYQLRWLGTGGEDTSMTEAIEFVGRQIDSVSDAINGLHEAVRSDHPLQGETLGGITAALEQIGEALNGNKSD